MADGARDDDRGRGRPGVLDAEAFARQVRWLALDTHRILNRPDASLDEVLGLNKTARSLLLEAPVVPWSETYRWLLAIRRAIGTRLESWPFEWLEVPVARA